MKSHAFRLISNTNQLDMKVYQVHRFLSMPFGKAPYLFYPRVYCVTNVMDVVGQQRSYGHDEQFLDWGFFTDDTEQSIVKPKIVQARQEKVMPGEAYIMDNGEYINLFVMAQIPDQFASEVSIEIIHFKVIILGTGANIFQ